jgi:hypothetical protein
MQIFTPYFSASSKLLLFATIRLGSASVPFFQAPYWLEASPAAKVGQKQASSSFSKFLV